MTRLLTVFIICIGLIALTIVVVTAAGDEEDILAAMNAHLDAINTESSAAIARHHLPGHSEFSANGRPLGVSGSFETQLARNKAIFESGSTFDWHHKDLNIQIFGNTAVVTGYVAGTTHPPHGDPIPVHNRRTTVLIKQQDEWKEIHVHNSPLNEDAGQ